MARKKAPAAPAAAVAERAAQHWTSRVMPLLAAPASFGAGAVGIEAMHHYWGGSPTHTPLYALGVTAVGGVSTWYATVAAGKHRVHLRWLSAATAGACTAGAVAGMIFGIGPIEGPYALGSLALSVLWAIRHGMKGAGGGEGSGHPLGQLGEAIGAERHHLFNIRRSGKGTVSATVQAVGGATVADFQASLPALAAAAGLPPGGAVLRPDDDNASIGHLELTVADLLKQTIPFPGIAPARIGELCTAPIPIARYADGEEFAASPLTRDGDIEHTLIVGVTGSGKSEYALAYLGTQCTRRQVSVIGIDATKGLQTFGPVVHGISRNGIVATDMRTARAVIKALAGPVCKARTAYLTSEGMTKWAPRTPRGTRTKINLLEVWIEEASDIADAKAYEEMLRRCRSAGIKIKTSLQRAIHDKIDTSARASHGGGIAFGCREDVDVRMALPDDVVDAGALPLWRNHKPGYHYCCALGADPDRWTTKLRAYYVHDRAQLAAAVTAAAAVIDPMDDITARAFGDLFAKRAVYPGPLGLALSASPDMAAMAALAAAAPAPAAAITPAPAAAPVITGVPVPAPRPGSAEVTADRAADLTAAALGGTETEEDEDMDDDLDVEDELTEADHLEIGEEREGILGDLDRARRDEIDAVLSEEAPWAAGDAATEYDDPDDDFNADPPVTGDIEMQLDDGEEGGDITAADARRMLCQQLEAWVQQGKREFAPRDLYPLLERMGRGRRWFYHARDELKDAGVIADGDDVGSYDIIGSPLAGITGTAR